MAHEARVTPQGAAFLEQWMDQEQHHLDAVASRDVRPAAEPDSLPPVTSSDHLAHLAEAVPRVGSSSPRKRRANPGVESANAEDRGVGDMAPVTPPLEPLASLLQREDSKGSGNVAVSTAQLRQLQQMADVDVLQPRRSKNVPHTSNFVDDDSPSPWESAWRPHPSYAGQDSGARTQPARGGVRSQPGRSRSAPSTWQRLRTLGIILVVSALGIFITRKAGFLILVAVMLACSIIYMMVNQPEPRVRPYGAGQPSPAIEQAAMAHGARMVHELARHRRTAPPGTFNEGSVHSASVSSDDFPRGLYRRSRGGTLHEVPAQDASRALSGGDDEPDDGAVREAAHELAALQGAALGPAGVTVDPAGKVTMEVLRRETAVLAGQAGIELGFSGGGGPETPAGLRAAMRALREAMCTWDQGGGYEHEDDGSDIGSTGTPGDKKDN